MRSYSSILACLSTAPIFTSVYSFQIPNRISITRTITTTTTAAPSTTNHYKNQATSAIFLSTITSPSDDDATKYRNRSLLLENTLRQKVQALKLSDQKLGVLQDAVKRVMAARTMDHDAGEESESAEMQILEWKARYERAETLRLEAVSELSDVQRQYHERKVKIQNERDRLIQDMESLQKNYRKDQKQWEADVEMHMQAQKKLVELDRDHKRMVRQINVLRTELEETQKELAHYRSSVKESSVATETEEALMRERERVKSLKAQWADLKVEKRHLEDIRAAHAESIQIAEASVAASERREDSLKKEIAALNEKYSELELLNKDLQNKLEDSATPRAVDSEIVVEASPYIVEQDEINHVKVPSELRKPSRFKRVASVIFNPVKSLRNRRAKYHRR